MRIPRNSLAGLVCVAVLIGCSSRPVETESAHGEEHVRTDRVSLSAEAIETAGIRIEAVGLRRHVPTIRVTGTLSYDERKMAIATARIGGRITKVIADYGQRVSEDEVLAWIDSPELGAAQAEYLRAESMSRLREAEYDRARLLLEGQAMSRGELLRREAEWRAAQADLETSEQKLHILGLSQGEIDHLSDDRAGRNHEYAVRAPIRGQVTDRGAVQGRVVAANDDLFTIARLDTLWLFLQIFEKDLPAVDEGTAVTLTCESHPDHRFSGTVDFVGQVLDPHSRTLRARAVIENPEGKLKPGMFVYATIEAGDADGEESARLAIPVSAVTRVDGRDVVFVRVDERTFEPRPVTLGVASQDWIEIRSGLSVGDRVAVEGVFTLKSEILKGGLEEHDH